jgi:hypothetical protein
MLFVTSVLLAAALVLVCVNEVLAYTWSVNCPTPDYTDDVFLYNCCNSDLDLRYCNPYSDTGTCGAFKDDSDFAGDLGKHSIGGSKTHTFHVSCGGHTICGAKWGHSGGTIDCILAGGGFGLTDSITYSCHNSAFSATGHVWMESVICVIGSGGVRTALQDVTTDPCYVSMIVSTLEEFPVKIKFRAQSVFQSEL